MKFVGLDIGTNYTKVTNDGENVFVFPSIVAYGKKRDWSLKGEEKDVYVGEEAIHFQSVEDIEILRPLHEGRIMHESYVELAKYALKKAEGDLIAIGLPVKSSRKEREEIKSKLQESLKKEIVLFPQPVGSLAFLNYDTGVCADIGFGTTDIAVLVDMEFLKGDTMLIGVDNIYESLELEIRNKTGVSITPEEMTKLLVEKKTVGRIRSGKKVSISYEDIKEDYERLMKSWIDRISSRVKMLIEGLSISIVENFVLSGGGAMLPGVHEEFQRHFSEIGEVITPENPLTSNVKGFYKLAKLLYEEKEVEEKKEEAPKEKKGRKKS